MAKANKFKFPTARSVEKAAKKNTGKSPRVGEFKFPKSEDQAPKGVEASMNTSTTPGTSPRVGEFKFPTAKAVAKATKPVKSEALNFNVGDVVTLKPKAKVAAEIALSFKQQYASITELEGDYEDDDEDAFVADTALVTFPTGEDYWIDVAKLQLVSNIQLAKECDDEDPFNVVDAEDVTSLQKGDTVNLCSDAHVHRELRQLFLWHDARLIEINRAGPVALACVEFPSGDAHWLNLGNLQKAGTIADRVSEDSVEVLLPGTLVNTNIPKCQNSKLINSSLSIVVRVEGTTYLLRNPKSGLTFNAVRAQVVKAQTAKFSDLPLLSFFTLDGVQCLKTSNSAAATHVNLGIHYTKDCGHYMNASPTLFVTTNKACQKIRVKKDTEVSNIKAPLTV